MRRIRSATWRWLLVCHSFCGTRFPTQNCSRSRMREGSRRREASSGRSSACSRILAPRHLPLGSRLSGCASSGSSDNWANYGITVLPHLRQIVISGPHSAGGVSETASRERVFTCRPMSLSEERPCAESIISDLASRAYRRPVTAADLAGLLSLYESGGQEGGFEVGVRTALQGILASPSFVFRLEEEPEDVAPGETYRLSDLALASRLSFFLWGTLPDAELLEFANAGRLTAPGGLERQVERMLEDPRSEALATRFASQWLRLQDLVKVQPLRRSARSDPAPSRSYPISRVGRTGGR